MCVCVCVWHTNEIESSIARNGFKENQTTNSGDNGDDVGGNGRDAMAAAQNCRHVYRVLSICIHTYVSGILIYYGSTKLYAVCDAVL